MIKPGLSPVNRSVQIFKINKNDFLADRQAPKNSMIKTTANHIFTAT